MATVIFTDDPVAEARALATALNLWLREQPQPEAAPPATVKLVYEGELLHTVTVTLGDD